MRQHARAFCVCVCVCLHRRHSISTSSPRLSRCALPNAQAPVDRRRRRRNAHVQRKANQSKNKDQHRHNERMHKMEANMIEPPHSSRKRNRYTHRRSTRHEDLHAQSSFSQPSVECFSFGDENVLHTAASIFTGRPGLEASCSRDFLLKNAARYY